MSPVPTTDNVTTEPRGYGYTARLGELLLRLASSPEVRGGIRTAPLEAQRINTSANPEDFGNEAGTRFSIADFSGGEGLDVAHRPDSEEDDALRFYDSRNVEVDDEGRVRLLRTTEQAHADTADPLRGVRFDSTVYWTSGANVDHIDDPTVDVASITVSSESPGGSVTSVTDLARLGDVLYAATNDGIKKRDGGTWSGQNSLVATRIWATRKGRLLASDGTGLYEVDLSAGTGSPAATVTLAGGESWTDVTDSGKYVLASATDGYVYAFTDDGSSFALSTQSYVEGEHVTAMDATYGVLVYLTAEQVSASAWVARLYTAAVNTDGILDDINRIRRWGDPDNETLDLRAHRIIVARDSAFFAHVEDGTETHMWRYDLRTGGLFRSYVYSSTGDPTDLTMLNSVPWLFLQGDGVYRRASTYASSGYVISPLADFFSADEKSWAGARVYTDSLAGAGESVSIYHGQTRDLLDTPNSADWELLNTITTGTQDEEAQISGVESRYLALKIEVTPGSSATTTPRIDGFVVRAYPGVGDVIVDLPVNVSDVVKRPGRGRVRIAGYGEKVYNHLKGIQGQSKTLVLYNPDDQMRGHVEAVEMPVRDFNSREAPTTVALVRFRGRRVVTTTTGPASIGSGKTLGTGYTLGAAS